MARELNRTSRKQIVILTADTGLGHRSTARAITAALEEQYGGECNVEIINPMDHQRASPLLRNSQADYDRMVREMPDLYRFGYQAISGPLPNALVESVFTVMLFEAIRDILAAFKPDVIVDTYESYLAPLDAVFAINRRRIPLLTVVTDLATLHRAWFNTVSDWCLVPSKAAYNLALDYGFPAKRLKITGLPINPKFAQETRSRREIREELGWHPDMIAVLAVGSARVNNLPETLHILNHSGLPIQLVAVAGGDETLYQAFQKVEWHHLSHVYNFVQNMPQLMRAADCVIGKAGGLFVSEALGCGLPLLLIDLIQGQETGNVELVVQGGAGELAANPVEALEILFHWLDNDHALLARRAEQARKMGNVRAAYDVADLVWQTALDGVVPRHKRTYSLQSLTDLLTRFDIPWRNS